LVIPSSHSQAAYDEEIEKLTKAFDRVESILSKQRYISEVYVVYFKCNTRSVAQSDVLLNYVREIYQMVGIRDTIQMDQIKLHYFASHPELNKYSIVPRGPNFEAMLLQPHNRASYSSSSNRKKYNLSGPLKTKFEKSETLKGWDAVLVG
jgi:glutathionyl-hydroquinone reductase